MLLFYFTKKKRLKGKRLIYNHTTMTTPTVPTNAPKVDTEMVELTNEFQELEATIQSMTINLIAMGKRVKKLEKTIVSLVKSRSKKTKTQKKEIPTGISPKLMTFMGLSEALTTRSEALRKISDYVRKTGLQLQDDKRTFVTDKVLSDLFSIPVGEKLTFLAINKYVTPLFTLSSKKEVVSTPTEVPVPVEVSKSVKKKGVKKVSK